MSSTTASLPWLRLYTETLSDRKIKLVSVDTGFPKPLIIGVWVSLLILAGESPDRGRILSARGRPMPFSFLCDEIGIDEEDCSRIIQAFIEMNMIYRDDDGAYVITKWNSRQFKSDDAYARVKKHRLEKRGKIEPTESPQEEEKGGIENDEYTKRFNGVSRNVSETFQETPQIQNQIQSPELIPNGIGDKSPSEPETPLKQLMGVFLQTTHLKMPKKKPDQKFWWSNIREIYNIVDEDVGRGREIITSGVGKLRADGFTIGGPESIIKTCRALASGQALQNGATQNGHSRTHQTGATRGTLKPRPMDEATIRDVESELAELERRFQIGGNPAGAPP